ncbi:2-keto-4-pentenoate hydratase [Hoyosella subflava]|uniref:Putative hydratase n=1 Tax=Hoyosella subflava (strain DSM 45089 / JCM 17490 / NBRC 109087 / DQS3-9A1) TaxID=443218 RepID=F6EQ51_HOYSD|nr:2-keto-4-pentenoate hydratase [Hoyosella subflava]AEF39474.1 Putative hydratase [Hoyosella subflava DQS3-9A1]
MEAGTISQAAQAILDAYDTGKPIEPVVDQFPGSTIRDAYRIQKEVVHQWLASGDTVKGHKVGLASLAMQTQMGVNQPDYGHLLTSMFHLEHLPIDTPTYLQPRIEPEIAFILGRQLSGPGVTVADALRAIDYVIPALEIVDSRIRDWRISIVDTIADNASSGGVVLGSKPTLIHQADLAKISCVMSKNGKTTGTGVGGAVLGSPINALVWLANTVGPLGTTLEPGHVILPGSMTRAEPIGAGDVVTATMGELGDVTAVFSDSDEQ